MIGTAAALGAAALGVGGAIAGSQGTRSSSTSGVNLLPASAAEGAYGDYTQNSFNGLAGILGNDNFGGYYADSQRANGDLASMLENYAKTGGLPTSTDIGYGNETAQSLFAPQRTALDQDQVRQQQGFAQQAGIQGRSVTDPVFQAKMRTQFANQNALLGAQQGAQATQIAMGLPGQRLGYAQDRAAVLDAASRQALQNRLTLLGMGNQLQNSERSFRLNASPRYGTQQSGGGLAGAINGGIAGIGIGAGSVRAIDSLFSNQSPQYAPAYAPGAQTPGPWAPRF